MREIGGEIMKVYYQTFLLGEGAGKWGKPGEIRKYKVDRVDFCCEQMKKAYEDMFIVFGVLSSTRRNTDVNITKCDTYPEGAFYYELPIRLCPFCGAEIETVETARFTQVKTTIKIPEREETRYEDKPVDITNLAEETEEDEGNMEESKTYVEIVVGEKTESKYVDSKTHKIGEHESWRDLHA